MSGGVDSSVAAALLVEQGYRVTGVHLKFWSPGQETQDEHLDSIAPLQDDKQTDRRPQRFQNVCCSLESEGDAKRVCDRLGIPFRVWDVQAEFYQEVVLQFLESYRRNETPNPCVICNEKIKLGWLVQKARTLGYAYVATGHWARFTGSPEQGFHLHQAANSAKDQSYFLYRLSQEILQHVLFPLGRFMSKDEVRALAYRYGLPTDSKPESQEVCFVPDGDLHSFLAQQAPDVLQPGMITDAAGKELGRHDGLALFTEGQRRGIGVAGGKPLYVVRKQAENNQLVLGTLAETGSDALVAREVHWLQPVPVFPFACTCRIRYKGTAYQAVVTPLHPDRMLVSFAAPVSGISPGQSAVFYLGDEVVGGGIISPAA